MSEPAATYVRHTTERLAEACRQPGDDLVVWQFVHLLSVIQELDTAGHGDAIRAAADRVSAWYDLAAQSEVDGNGARVA